MGLKSNSSNGTGVKAMLKTQVPRAFARFENLHDARDAVMRDGDEEAQGDGREAEPIDVTILNKRQRTVVFLDGNVLMMTVPEAIGEIDAFCAIIYGYVREAMRTGSLVVVAFDEPQHLTQAKREEQQRRDAQRMARTVACSDDMQPVPLGHNFTRAELEALPDVHVLKADRKCRVRLYDEVIRRVYERAVAVMRQWEANGHDGGMLILDGVEIRGADRSADEPREVGLVGSNPEVLAKFQRQTPIGEGDIKLIALENRLRELITTDPKFEHYRLAVTSTTDTDSFMTFLIDTAKRRVNPYAGALHSLFCMREPPTKRDREVDENCKASFLCCDTALLEANIQQHLWGLVRSPKPQPEQMLAAMLAFCSAAAICGCDFTLDGLKGSRFDHFWESMPSFVATEPQALARFVSALDQQEAVAQSACQGLYRVCVQASKHMEDKPRYKKQAESVGNVPDAMLRRAVWSASYWALNEFPATPDWGFLPVWGA
jgi:hypothetical protein